ncbi:DUF4286 family protein [Sphingopyxis macrogoltabida]|uniref:DUF4286 family protein n=1 Tax=Sphingopyxis macrogoltabida TaxID=33050 RepID=UPI0006ED37C3|nr:DUF4286 family protein [Sphingopyxis macrogoltabida]ALJ16399.1 hypothetical protein LH19_26735 [Sphingopyxis macrogoltabida]
MIVSKLIVLSNPVEGKEDEFNKWYDQQHVPDIMRVPGVVGAQRFRGGAGTKSGVGSFRYLAIFDIESPEPGLVVDEIMRRSGTDEMPRSDAISSTRFAMLYEPIGNRLEKA